MTSGDGVARRGGTRDGPGDGAEWLRGLTLAQDNLLHDHHSCPRQSLGQQSGAATVNGAQRQLTGVGGSDSGREQQSPRRIQQAPGHGTGLIEGVHRFTGSIPADRPGVSEKLQVAVNLFRRGVGDPPVVQPVSTNSAVPFCQVRWDRKPTGLPDRLSTSAELEPSSPA